MYTEPPIKAVSTRVSTRASFNSNTTNSADSVTPEHFNIFVDSPVGLEEEEDDEEWNATFTPTKKRAKTKAGKKIGSTKSNTSLSKKP